MGDEEDVGLYVGLARSLHPKSVLGLACGTGRITVPLAEEGARSGFSVVGPDSEANMLQQARDKAKQISAAARKRVKLVNGDMRKWHGREPFDLIVVPCASITHLLDLRDQTGRLVGNLSESRAGREICSRDSDAEFLSVHRLVRESSSDAGRDRSRRDR